MTMLVNIKMVDKVMYFRTRNALSFRQIAKLLGKDLKTVYRWYDYGVGRQKYVGRKMQKLSTEKLDNVGTKEYN